MVVLGISLGSRTTGIAVIKDNELLVARSVTVRNKKSTVHTATLSRYIQQYKIFLVVIKMPPLTHISERIKELLSHCLTLFQYHGCMVEYKDTKNIKETMPEITNKLDMIKFVTITYPGLVPEMTKELSNKNKYHQKMFEAVMVAHVSKEQKHYPPY